MIRILFKSFLVTVFVGAALCNQLRTAREQHRTQPSTNNDFRYLASLTDSNYVNKVLDNILIPRVVGTENHEKVFKYIVRELHRLKWHIEVDEFVERAPIFGDLTFKNIIATPNPDAERFVVLACHYDSKYFANAVFVGAIDSAVPCAMMLEAAKSLSKELEQNKDAKVALKLFFFDGEEAFVNWGPNDSIYGAKHLAKQLHNNKTRIAGDTVTQLDRIDVLILLDLIGARNPTFSNNFENTQRWYFFWFVSESTLIARLQVRAALANRA
jgi:glutaminyl-peptide cyclotransferase